MVDAFAGVVVTAPPASALVGQAAVWKRTEFDAVVSDDTLLTPVAVLKVLAGAVIVITVEDAPVSWDAVPDAVPATAAELLVAVPTTAAAATASATPTRMDREAVPVSGTVMVLVLLRENDDGGRGGPPSRYLSTDRP
jgi:hypothetical protein